MRYERGMVEAELGDRRYNVGVAAKEWLKNNFGRWD